jgi:DNA-binding response OmpR family regulator
MIKMKNIVIVEDDRSLQDILQIILGPEEYRLQKFSSAEPVENGEFQLPDLFILDWRLPGGKDGVELCKKLKANSATKHIPVLMISGMPNIVQVAKNAGADGAIDKPFRIKAIRESVRRHLTRSA